jgi:hypothetical protein
MKDLHDQRRQAVRQQVNEHDPPRRIADGARRVGIFHFAHPQHLAADQAQIGRDLRDRNRKRHIARRIAHRCGDAHGEHEGREGHHGIHRTHRHIVDPAAAIADDGAEQGADGDSSGRGRKGHRQIDTRGIDDARELIAAIEIGAEPMLPGYRLQRRAGIGRIRRIGRD